MRRGLSIEEIGIAIEAGTPLVARAIRAAGDRPAPNRSYRLATVARGLAVLVTEAERNRPAADARASTRGLFSPDTKGTVPKPRPQIADIVKAVLSKITTPRRRVG